MYTKAAHYFITSCVLAGKNMECLFVCTITLMINHIESQSPG